MSQVDPPARGPGTAAGPAAPAVAQSPLPGAIADPPPAVAGLAVGSILKGVVLRHDAQGHAVVQTDLGSLLVTSPAKLPDGSQVALQIRAAGSQLLIAVLQIDGHPVAGPGTPHGARQATPPGGHPGGPAPPEAGGPAGQGGPPAPGSSTGPPTVATASADVLALGQVLRAVVQAPPAPGSATAGQAGAALPVLAVGSRLQVKVLRVDPAQGQASQGQASQPSHAPQGAGGDPRGPVPPPAGGRLHIQALVSGAAAKGHPVVASPLGTLTLSVPAALPMGTRLLLELAAADLGPAARGAAGQGLAGDPRPAALAYHWPALREVLELAGPAGQTGGPDHGAALARGLAAARGLPRPGPRLASSILFFLQALGGGGLDTWLGATAAEALRAAGRGDLVTRLAQDVAQLGRLAETPGGEWRFLPIPLAEGGALHQIRLFLRRRPGGGKGGKGGGAGEPDPATRFIVDLENARLGALQLDGLVRSKRFDLVMRSRRPLDTALRHDITVIFDEATTAAGYAGQIGFQASSDWHPMTLETAAEGAPGLVV